MRKICYLSCALFSCICGISGSVDGSALKYDEISKDDFASIHILNDNNVEKYVIDSGKIEDLQKHLKKEEQKYTDEMMALSEKLHYLLHRDTIFEADNDVEMQINYNRKISKAVGDMVRALMLESVARNALKNLHNPQPKVCKDLSWQYDSKNKETLLYTRDIMDITLPSEIENFKKDIQELNFKTLIKFYNAMHSDQDIVKIPD